jgi:hypothetical protein
MARRRKPDPAVAEEIKNKWDPEEHPRDDHGHFRDDDPPVIAPAPPPIKVKQEETEQEKIRRLLSK